MSPLGLHMCVSTCAPTLCTYVYTQTPEREIRMHRKCPAPHWTQTDLVMMEDRSCPERRGHPQLLVVVILHRTAICVLRESSL